MDTDAAKELKELREQNARLTRSTYRRLPIAQTPTDPDAHLRAWLRAYATKHPCHDFRRACAALRHDESRVINVKKVHRL